MQHMFLIYLEEATFAVMSQPERDAFGNGMLDYDEELKASGHYICQVIIESRCTKRGSA